MSDLLSAARKTEEGARWRGELSVEIDGEVRDLTYRQLFDSEMRQVEALIDDDLRDQVEEAVPDEIRNEYEELQSLDPEERTEEDEERIAELEQDMQEFEQEVDFDDDFFEALQLAAKKCIVPDEEDITGAMNDAELVRTLEDEYGCRINERSDLYDPDEDAPGAGGTPPLKRWVQDRLIEKSTGGISYRLGMRVLTKQGEDAKNS